MTTQATPHVDYRPISDFTENGENLERVTDIADPIMVMAKDLSDAIAYEYYFTAYDAIQATQKKNTLISEHCKRLTHCVLVLTNGYVVTGESACVDPRNYDKALGEHYAREDAVEKMWPLLGYALTDRIHRQQSADT